MSDALPTAAAAPQKVRKVRLSSLTVDLQKEREGAWEPATEIGPEVQYLLRSTNYPPFRTARDVHSMKLVKKYGDKVPEEVSAEVYGRLAVQHLLLDWKGFVDDDEDNPQDIPFSKELAETILTDPQYRNVRGSVYAAAMRVGQQEVEFVEATVKN